MDMSPLSMSPLSNQGSTSFSLDVEEDLPDAFDSVPRNSEDLPDAFNDAPRNSCEERLVILGATIFVVGSSICTLSASENAKGYGFIVELTGAAIAIISGVCAIINQFSPIPYSQINQYSDDD